MEHYKGYKDCQKPHNQPHATGIEPKFIVWVQNAGMVLTIAFLLATIYMVG